MEHYSRSNRKSSPETTQARKPTSHRVKTGLSAFQKTVATISSILSIIIACFTIMTLINKDKTDKPTNTGATTTIIHEVEKNPTLSSQLNQNQSETNSSDQTTAAQSTESTPSSTVEATSATATETPASTEPSATTTISE